MKKKFKIHNIYNLKITICCFLFDSGIPCFKKIIFQRKATESIFYKDYSLSYNARTKHLRLNGSQSLQHGCLSNVSTISTLYTVMVFKDPKKTILQEAVHV